MTNDYYINLANYYTNQLIPTNKVPFIYKSVSDKEIKFDEYFTNTIGATYYTIEKWLTWDGSNNLVLYGTVEISGNAKNFILRVPYSNETYDLSSASFFTTYEGGTSLPYFWELKVDNDGTLYGIVSSSSADSNGFALIMISNPFTTGGIKFRQSYVIPNTYSSYTNYQMLIKKENTGEYLIIFSDGGANTLILHMTINVGGINNFEATTINDYLDIKDYYISWNENIMLNLLAYDSSGEISDYIIRYKVYTYNGNSITLTKNYSYSIGNRFSSNTAKYYTQDIIYFGIVYLDNYNSGAGKSYNAFYRANIQTNQTSILNNYSYDYNTTTPYYLESVLAKKQQIEMGNDLIYFKWLRTELPYPNNRTAFDIYIPSLGFGNVLFSSVNNTLDENYNFFFVNNIFNMYKAIIPGSVKTTIINFRFDPYGNSFQRYIDLDMFVPHRIRIYNDALTRAIFDRNLYNLRIYNNVTEATFNIPYNLLNDVVIGNSMLLGMTNYPLVDDYTTIIKNIYENLMINFFNSIVVKDYTGRIYNSGGARVNNSISKTNDMSNASARKLKIFYSDNTTTVQTLNPPTITGTGNPMTITYEIIIYVDSLGSVLKYQILSNDEQTLYFEYDMSLVDTGLYKITQNCSVE